MPFSQTTRDKALVASARHCCVCHRYKGVKVEVHHIVPEFKGGPSDDANAITLCFDCHADAGHYNSKHPRGTKFSPKELEQHRDRWHALVRANNIQPPEARDVLYCRFLLCESYDAIREISVGDLSNVPVNQPLLVTNSILLFQRTIVKSHPVSYRHDNEPGDSFSDRAAYTAAHPDVPLHELSTIEGHPYFQTIRAPLADELRVKLAPKDSVTRLLLEADVAPENISYALGYWEACGDDRFQEIYRLRPLWALYFAITNIGQDPVTLNGIECEKYEPTGTDYREFLNPSGSANTVEELPAVPVPPNATVLFPVATLLGPIESISSEITFEEQSDLPNGQVQVLSHRDLSAGHTKTALIGPVCWPKVVSLQIGGLKREQQVHDFNLSALYTISRYWEMGSCPHLFLIGQTARPVYVGELFARRPGEMQTERIIIPALTTSLLICELESEITTLREIRINETFFARDLTLMKGDMVRIPVLRGDVVEMTGYYVAPVVNPTDPWLRNTLIKRFIELTPDHPY